MKKCRRFIQKIPVSVLAILLMVSAFFYGSMDVNAADTVTFTGNTGAFTGNLVRAAFENHSSTFDLVSDLESDLNYLVEYDLDFSLSFSTNFYLRNVLLKYGDLYLFDVLVPDPDYSLSSSFSKSGSFVCKGSDLMGKQYSCTGNILKFTNASNVPSIGSTTPITYNITFDVLSVTVFEQSDADSYESGYNAGYSTGYADGESSGYTDGFQAGVDSVDTDSYYNSGYQAGVDSVDTQSYYDAGYSAGYNVGLQESYQAGYDEGYADAMSTIEGWGADGKNYPLLISDVYKNVTCSIPISPDHTNDRDYSNIEIFRRLLDLDSVDPNHTYKVTFVCDDISIDKDSSLYYDDISFWLVVGGYEYPIGMVVGTELSSIESFCYISGDVMSSNISLKIGVQVPKYISDIGVDEFLYVDLWNSNIKVFDCGPTGNTQNHIANQTDELTNGYDSSAGESTSSSFSDGVSEYEEVEGSLFTSAKSGLADYQFFDIESVPAVVTGLSFVTSIMTGIFNSMGGASGAGIVLSVLFSVMLVSIVSGLYRYFVSSGRSGKHDKKGGAK